MNAVTKLKRLRSAGTKLSHDHGYSESLDDMDNDYDEERLKRGISFFGDNFFSMFVSMLTGLLSLMYIDTIASVLDITRKSSSAPLSFSRYLSTLNHTLAWYQDLPSLLKSSGKVRQLHKKASQMKRFSQYDMVITQWAFVGPVLLWPERLGISGESRDKIDGLLYVMYVVGRELGICDEYNLCKGSVSEVEKFAREILEKEIQPKFQSVTSSEISSSLADYLLNGVHILNPFINPDGFRCWSQSLIQEEADSNNNNNNDETGANLMSYYMSNLQFIVLDMFHKPYIGAVLRYVANALMKLNIYLATDWESWMLQDLMKNKKTDQKSLGAEIMTMLYQLFYMIPSMVVISSLNVMKQKLKQH